MSEEVLVIKDPSRYLTLEAGHSCSHDLINQKQVGGNHGAAVDHLPLDSETMEIGNIY